MGRAWRWSPDDTSTTADLHSHPGADTRQWGTWGTVMADPKNPDQASVRFTKSDGTPLSSGVLVDVVLQPSAIPVQCHVLGQVAGDGEADYYPFAAGDAVFVLVPEGDERAGCAIVGRGTNKFDAWPKSVAGADPTTNKFGFRRMRTPYIIETAASYLIRSAATGAQIGIDATGQVVVGDATGSSLFFSPDVASFQLKDGTAGLQLDAHELSAKLLAGGSILKVDDQKSAFQSAGTFKFELAGEGAFGHAVTVEQVLGILGAFIKAAALASVPPGPPGAAGLAAFFVAMAVPGAFAPILAAASKLPLDPAVQAALAAALATPPDPTGTLPGVGNAALMF